MTTWTAETDSTTSYTAASTPRWDGNGMFWDSGLTWDSGATATSWTAETDSTTTWTEQ